MIDHRVLRALRKVPSALLWSSGLHLRSVVAALFVERVYLTALFLLLATPYIVLYAVYGRVRPSSRKTKGSPFIYTMQ